MNLPVACIHRPVMTTLLMMAFVIFGIFGYRLLPVAALPRVDFPTIVVTGQLPGAAPETMASSVAAPLERQFSTIAGLNSIISSSSQGYTAITMQFDLGRDIDGAALDVQSAMTTAAKKLPIEMTIPPSFQKINPADQPVLFITLASNILPLSVVDEYAETMISQRVSTLPGIAQVQVFGAQKFAVRVQVDPQKLAAMGIGIDDIKNALASANSNTPVGSLNGPSQTFTLQATGALQQASQYKPIIVAYRNGAPVRLGDVALVVDSVQNDKTASWINGTRNIQLAVFRQPDANTVAVVDSVKELLPIFIAQLPPSIQLTIVNDRSISIRASIDDVQFTLMLTVGLVILVIFIFLRNVTATVIPALALPVSLIGTFAGMYVMGYSIDNLSLLAITLSVGFVVDDAIVMLENIVRHIENGMRPMEAALKGSAEIGFTILSITLSLVAVFIPVLFMGGIVGRLFREFAVTISMTILISGIVSLTLTPMLCSRLLKSHHGEKHNILYRISEAGFDAVLRFYGATLSVVLAWRRTTIMVTFISLGIAMYLYAIVPKGFFPTEDTGGIFGITEVAQDTSFDAMSARQQVAAAAVERNPAIQDDLSSVGFSGLLNQGRLFLNLKPREGRKDVGAVIQELRREVAQIPGIKVFFQPIQNIQVGGRLAKGAYQYTLQDGDLAELYVFAPQMEKKVGTLAGFQDVTSDLQIGNLQAVVDIDRDKASQLGITADTVRSTLFSAYGARQVSTIYTASNDYQVILQTEQRFQQDPADLSRIYVRPSGPNAAPVPLNAFATVRSSVGPLTVNHQSQLPSVTITFNLAPGVSLGEAVERIQQAEREMRLPVTITTGFQGTAQVFQDSLRGQGLLLVAAVLVIYMVLGILYESFIHPITILSGLPSAGLGALLTLMLFGQDLSVIAIIGIIMLIGIVKKNAIMIIDFALERRRIPGTTAEEAIHEACLLRFRPIMMTTMAAIMGTLPIALGVGTGAELRRPLGLAVVGGLIVSQLLTLYITPVVYIYMEKLSTALSRKGKHGDTRMPHDTVPAPGE